MSHKTSRQAVERDAIVSRPGASDPVVYSIGRAERSSIVSDYRTIQTLQRSWADSANEFKALLQSFISTRSPDVGETQCPDGRLCQCVRGEDTIIRRRGHANVCAHGENWRDGGGGRKREGAEGGDGVRVEGRERGGLQTVSKVKVGCTVGYILFRSIPPPLPSPAPSLSFSSCPFKQWMHGC